MRVTTTILEVLGLALIVAGVYLAFGLAVALMVAGLLVIGISFLITAGGRK